MTANNTLERTVNRWGRAVLAIHCQLAGAEFAARPAAQFNRYAATRSIAAYDCFVKTTLYCDAPRKRPDRAVIRDEWIERAIRSPIKEMTQTDGRIRRWVLVPEAENRYLRVVLLADGETVHNAFFDRRFVP